MINILPPQYKTELQQEKQWKTVLILGIVVLSFLICLTLTLFSIKIYISGQISAEKIFLELEEKRFKTSETQKLEEEIKSLNKKLTELRLFYQTQSDLTYFLEKISNTIPSGVYFSNFSFNLLTVEGKYLADVSVSGYSPTRETLMEFKNNLEQTENFEEISFPPSCWVETKDINFSVTFKIK